MRTERSDSASWVRPTLTLFGRRWSSFQICGAMGLLVGTSLAMFLATQSGSSRAVVGGLLAMGVLTFLALAMATKIITGRESLVYYHHEVAILSTSAVLLAAFDQPVLPYLDVTALGLGVFLAFGRCGCLMVGCCHGKPHSWGVRYGQQHATEGFPACYVGVRLFPVQALESITVAVIVAVGVVLVLRGDRAGAALSWYIVSYSTARIWLEELRGDRARPYWLRLSEAQWTSLLLIVSVMLAEWQGRLPFSRWHLVICAGAATSLLVIAWSRTIAHAIVHPRHASEIAEIVKSPSGTGRSVSVHRTSLSIGVSTESLGGGGAMLYSLSRADRRLTLSEAHALARLIVNLVSRSGRRQELLRGNYGVFHVIVHRTPG